MWALLFGGPGYSGDAGRGAGPQPVAYVVLPHEAASGSLIGGAGPQDDCVAQGVLRLILAL